MSRLFRWFRPCAALFVVLLGANFAAADTAPARNVLPAPFGVLTTYDYAVLHTWPHDRGAFTQGLFFLGDELIESTGLNGRSTLRRVAWQTGEVRQRIDVPAQYFAEGAVALNRRIFQLTWQAGVGFIYDATTFAKLGEFHYDGEGWGLTTDGEHLILSDGTPRIRYLDAQTFAVVRTIEVRHDGKPMQRLNELELIGDEIFASVWQTAYVLRIDAATGDVRGVIDFRGLLTPQDRTPDTDVLNGIAYDPAHDRLLVTGKNWPKLFEVRLTPHVAGAE